VCVCVRECVCVCVCVCVCACLLVCLSASLFDNDSVRRIISLARCRAVKDLSMSLGVKGAKQTFYIYIYIYISELFSLAKAADSRRNTPAEKFKVRGAVGGHHEL